MDKARIYNVDKDTKTAVVECMFNPSEYTFVKTNTWNQGKLMGTDLPLAHFGGGGAMTLTLSLLFDTYSTDEEDDAKKDVREHTEKLLALMKVDPSLVDPKNDKGRPPRVMFAWGKYFGFKAVISSITQRFTLFLPDGKPVRATLDVNFQQVESDGTFPAQNPTSQSLTQKVRVVSPGETIDSIAFDEYGDAARWRLIADYNELDDPMRLRPGQKIAIPPLS